MVMMVVVVVGRRVKRGHDNLSQLFLGRIHGYGRNS